MKSADLESLIEIQERMMEIGYELNEERITKLEKEMRKILMEYKFRKEIQKERR